MKYVFCSKNYKTTKSRPARGAWVEMTLKASLENLKRSRAPQGARGLKYIITYNLLGLTPVAPRKGRVG